MKSSENLKHIYNEDYYIHSAIRKAPFRKRMEDEYYYLIGIKKGDVVLDIACGIGDFSFWAANEEALVWGVDYSPYSIRFCDNRKTDKYRCPFFMQGDATKIDFDNNTFDKVVSIETIEHLSEEEGLKFLGEAHRVLKEDGILFIKTPNGNAIPIPPWYYHVKGRKKFEEHIFNYTKKDLKKKLEAAGFEVLMIKVYSSMKYPIIKLLLNLPIIKKYFGFKLIALCRKAKQ